MVSPRLRVPTVIVTVMMAFAATCWAQGGSCPVIPPGQPEVDRSDCDGIALHWAACEFCTAYTVEFQASGTSTWSYGCSTNLTQCAIPASSLPPNADVRLRILGRKDGCTAVVSEAPVETRTARRPSKPAAGATVVANPNGTVTFTWQLVGDYSTNVSAEFLEPGSGSASVSANYAAGTITIPLACPLAAYAFRSVSGDGCRALADQNIVTQPAKPDLVAPGDGAQVASSSIDLQWSGCRSFKYRAEVCRNAQFSPSQTTYGPETTELSYSFAPTAPGTYFWRVRVKNGNHELLSLTRSFFVPMQIIAPIGSEIFAGGSTQTVRWSGGGTARIELFPDPTVGTALQGGSVVLSPGASGGSWTGALPDIATSRARVQISQVIGSTTLYSFSPSPFRLTGSVLGAWSFEPLDSPGAGGTQSAIAGNGGNGVDVLLYDVAEGVLKLASRADKTQNWQLTTVPGASQFGLKANPAFARDASGGLHVAYFFTLQGNSGELRYTARNPSGQWSAPVSLAYVGDVRGDMSLVVDHATQQPVVAFNSGSAGGERLKVLRRSGTSWQVIGDLAVSSPQQITLVESAATGQCYLACRDAAGAHVYAWFYSGTGFVAMPIPLEPGPYSSVALALDYFFQPQLAYAAQAAGGFQHVVRHEWTSSGFGPASLVDAQLGSISSVAICHGYLTPTIAYACNGVIRIAQADNNGVWSKGVVEQSGDLDGPVHLHVTAPDGDRYVVYQDRGASGFRAASPLFNDVTPPAGVNPQAESASCTEVAVTFMAPGDDGVSTGRATAYALRSSRSRIDTEAKFTSATAVTTTAPGVPGTPERLIVNLGECSPWTYFAIKTRDEVPNWSSLGYTSMAVRTPCPQSPAECEGGGVELGHPTEAALGVSPNPTSVPVDIVWWLPPAQGPTATEVAVFDVAGRSRFSVRPPAARGAVSRLQWNLHDARGQRVPPGLYLVRIRSGDLELRRRILVTR